MYKIKEIANIIGVETVEIHKKLLNLAQELKGHRFEDNGFTVVDEKGLSIIERSFITTTEEKREEQNSFESEDTTKKIIEEKEKNEDLEENSLAIKTEINKIKKYINVLDEKINETKIEFEKETETLANSTKKLKAIQKEFYKKVIKR